MLGDWGRRLSLDLRRISRHWWKRPGERTKMKVNENAFVGYPVTNLKRARQFYEGVLGLKAAREFGDENEAWVEYDLGPHTLAITNGAPYWKPSPRGGSAGFVVHEFQAAVTTL